MDNKKFGLIGHPISHSYSPNLFYQYHQGTSDRYELIENESFDEAFKIFLQEYDAINVTAPFKERAYRAAELLDKDCALCGASNLLKKVGDGIHSRKRIKAYNTDIFGVECSILNHATETVEGVKGVVIGAGGAGKAAVLALLRLGMNVTLVNRDLTKCLEYAERLKIGGYHNLTPAPLSSVGEVIKESKYIVYTLPVSIESIVALDFSNKVILEANYIEPHIKGEYLKETTLYISGKEWLLNQAQAAWDIFYDNSI